MDMVTHHKVFNFSREDLLAEFTSHGTVQGIPILLYRDKSAFKFLHELGHCGVFHIVKP
jgi:hypothetical protein